jgi:hypothetical protein
MITATSTKALADAMPDFQTGDVLLFEGNPSNPLDWAIQHEEGAPYTHSGMIIRRDGALYFWDAPGAGETFVDPYAPGANKLLPKHDGCRVAPLDELLSYYMKSEIALFWRQLSPALSADQVAAMNIFINIADGLPFPMQTPKLPDEMNLGLGIAASYALGKKFQLTHAGEFYCAQLLAETYMRMGLMMMHPAPANAYAPADFAGNALPLIGCSLGPVVQLQAPTTATRPATATATQPAATG